MGDSASRDPDPVDHSIPLFRWGRAELEAKEGMRCRSFDRDSKVGRAEERERRERSGGMASVETDKEDE